MALLSWVQLLLFSQDLNLYLDIYIYIQISTHLIHFGPPVSVSWIVECMCFSLIKMFI